jgi:glycosyltransferase involved in cell wall biosynthesis
VTEPLVSVIIPTYNRVSLLCEAIESVRRQTYRSWELIVVVDGSTDETDGVLAGIADARLRVVRLDHCGQPGRVRNAGLAEARGAYVAFLDDDDLWRAEKLAIQVPLLATGPYRWSYTGFERVDATGRPFWRTTPDRIFNGAILAPLLEIRAAVALPTVVAERSLVEEAGRFDETMKVHEDHALWLDLASRTDVVSTPAHLTMVREHPGRVFRPEGYRFMVALYQRWHGRLTDPALRRACRRRIAETYLQDARYRWSVGGWRVVPRLTLAALWWDAPHAARRVTRALARRTAAWLGTSRGAAPGAPP